MNWLILFVTCLLFIQSCWGFFLNLRKLPPPPPPRRFAKFKDPIPLKFDQKLDHFNPNSNITWPQFYAVGDHFYKNESDSPIFLFLSGESPAEFMWLKGGTWIDMAKQHGALCFILEHRYYGNSHPTSDLSVQNLKYLSSEQAIADAANFIESMNKKYKLHSSNKWILFGGSYSGCLVAWARLKYPHLVYGAVSSSAPILAKADFFEYVDVVEASLNTYNKKCGGIIKEANLQLLSTLNEPNGPAKIREMFSLCSTINIENEKDMATLFSTLASSIFGIVQYNQGVRNHTKIDGLCSFFIDSNKETPLQTYADYYYRTQCLDFKYEDMLKPLQNTNYNKYDSMRLWIYQTCTEFGFYQTSEKNSSLFGPVFDLKYYEDTCTDIYGPEFNATEIQASVDRTNKNYGGLNINTTRVIFVHGSIDPWHALGLLNSQKPDITTIFIEGTSHCADMSGASSTNLPQLNKAIKQVEDLVGEWLQK